ncbi:hypothetical protein CYY_004400 [Polysphondylium violaceum]|uniref:MOSC domain-containing protein n=1 Tax=Polysphondylium violaceum TaxID=133409 RepID=A0A8J4Q5G4_9MYCE|nr:hypothetical protein CYY_004400 [Polysphondylium violaceum]
MSTFGKWIESNIGFKALASAGAVAMASYYFYYHYLINKAADTIVPYTIPSNFDESQRKGEIRVKSLFVYPIKSCKGVQVDKIALDQYGVVNDRRFLLTHNNRFITQRVYPNMAHIEPQFSQDGKELIVTAPGMDRELRVPLDPAQLGGQQVDVVIWKDTTTAIDCGEEANKWFSEYFGKDIKMVTIGEGYKRRIEKQFFEALNYQDQSEQDKDKLQTSFCDGAHIHILSEASIARLNSLIRATRHQKHEKQEADLTVQTFRPNVLVENAFADEEDSWSTFDISGTTFKRVEHTPRCKLTTVDPNKGVIDIYGDNEPIRTLRQFKNINGQPVFGIVCIHEQDGRTISIGDTIKKL